LRLFTIFINIIIYCLQAINKALKIANYINIIIAISISILSFAELKQIAKINNNIDFFV